MQLLDCREGSEKCPKWHHLRLAGVYLMVEGAKTVIIRIGGWVVVSHTYHYLKGGSVSQHPVEVQLRVTQGLGKDQARLNK
jgi:hypothetical protein